MRTGGLGDADRGRALAVVARLNSNPGRILGGGEVSPGEMRKLMLTLGILDAPELVVMDEPTNHLDLGSIEALERLLAAFPGALLLVSHDTALVWATTRVTWAIGGGLCGLQAYSGRACQVAKVTWNTSSTCSGTCLVSPQEDDGQVPAVQRGRPLRGHLR